MAKFLKEGLIYGVGGALSKFTGIFLTPIYTRMLDKSEFGILDFGTITTSILILICEAQLVSAFMRFYLDHKKSETLGNLVYTVGGAVLLQSSLLLLGLTGLLVWKGIPFDQVNWAHLRPILLSVPFAILTQLYLAHLRMERKPRAYIYVSIGLTWMSAFLGILFLFLLKKEALVIFWALFTVRFIVGVYSWTQLSRWKGSFSLGLFKEIRKYAYPILPAVLSNWSNRYISRYFILSILSVSALAYFGLAAKVAAIFLVFVTAFRMAWNPLAFRWFEMENTEKNFVAAFDVYYFIGGSVWLGLSALTIPLVYFFGGPEYLVSIALVPLVIGGYFWDGGMNILAIGNNWSKKTAYNLIGSSVSTIMTVVLLWYFLETYGVLTAAVAYFISSLLQSLLIFITAQYNRKLPFKYAKVASGYVLSIFHMFVFYWVLNAHWSNQAKTFSLLMYVLVISFVLYFTYLNSQTRKEIRDAILNRRLISKAK
ncbi:lipopolysaccharide biosynthesis protein [Cryomorphaceae bacterium]|nr:lipopolysaccharide biosynthesis protein [Cryomorphaceae bacterium]